ncbi:hypothetical protein ACLOJK_015286 [Asimina triloba]
MGLWVSMHSAVSLNSQVSTAPLTLTNSAESVRVGGASYSFLGCHAKGKSTQESRRRPTAAGRGNESTEKKHKSLMTAALHISSKMKRCGSGGGGGGGILEYFWGDTPEEEYYKSQGIRGFKSLYTSPRSGLTLFTRSWQPLSSPPQAIICMVHGYGNDISWTFQSTPIFLARMGFASFAVDLQGHGLSQGLKAFVPDVALLVDDCLSLFNSIKQDPQFRGLPCFLYGESMGGAICLLIHLKAKDLEGAWNGAILVAPMCKISNNIRPKWPLPQLLTFLAKFFPTLPIVPTADLLEKSVKVPHKKMVAARNPRRYGGKPRLGTVVELLRVTDYLHTRLSDVSLPFIVLHGSADVVTDPDVSRSLYRAAKSEDKTLNIYDGMMHSLLFGETDENVAIVRNDRLFMAADNIFLYSSSAAATCFTRRVEISWGILLDYYQLCSEYLLDEISPWEDSP